MKLTEAQAHNLKLIREAGGTIIQNRRGWFKNTPHGWETVRGLNGAAIKSLEKLGLLVRANLESIIPSDTLTIKTRPKKSARPPMLVRIIRPKTDLPSLLDHSKLRWTVIGYEWIDGTWFPFPSYECSALDLPTAITSFREKLAGARRINAVVS